MLNIIKMDLRHMFKNKSTWVILLISVALVFISAFSIHFMVETMEEVTMMQITEAEEMSSDVAVGINMNMPFGCTSDECPFFGFVMNYLSGGFCTLLLGIFTVIFVNSDNNSGFLKSISGQLKNRENLIFAKLTSICLYTVMIFVVSIISSLAVVYILFPSVTYGNVQEFIAFALTQLLLHIAFCAIIMCITVILRNSALSMVISIVLSSGLITLIYSLIDYALPSSIRENFSIKDYTVTGNISFLEKAASSDYVRIVIVGAAFIIAAVLLSSVIFKKRDIK